MAVTKTKLIADNEAWVNEGKSNFMTVSKKPSNFSFVPLLISSLVFDTVQSVELQINFQLLRILIGVGGTIHYSSTQCLQFIPSRRFNN